MTDGELYSILQNTDERILQYFLVIIYSFSYIVYQWVTQDTKRSIDNARRPGHGSMMCPTINEESDCLRKKTASPFSLLLQFLGDRADVAMLVLPLLIRQKGTAKPKGESSEKSISDFVEIIEVSYFKRLYFIRLLYIYRCSNMLVSQMSQN